MHPQKLISNNDNPLSERRFIAADMRRDSSTAGTPDLSSMSNHEIRDFTKCNRAALFALRK